MCSPKNFFGSFSQVIIALRGQTTKVGLTPVFISCATRCNITNVLPKPGSKQSIPPLIGIPFIGPFFSQSSINWSDWSWCGIHFSEEGILRVGSVYVTGIGSTCLLLLIANLFIRDVSDFIFTE